MANIKILTENSDLSVAKLTTTVTDTTKVLAPDGAGAVTWVTASGGSDPWTNVILGADFTTTSTTHQNVTGLAFTPAANTRYFVEAYLLLQTAAGATGPRPGFAFPTGLADAAGGIQAPQSATTVAERYWGDTTVGASADSAGLPATNISYLATGQVYMVTSASPSGNLQVTLRSEATTGTVTAKAHSFLRYRTIT